MGVSFKFEFDIVEAEVELFPADPPVGAAGPDLEGVEPDPEELLGRSQQPKDQEPRAPITDPSCIV